MAGRAVFYYKVKKPDTLLVINPGAGGLADKEALANSIVERLTAVGRRCTVHQTQADEDLPEVVRSACDGGVKLVIAVGGDGTVGEVVNGLVGTRVPLGIVPAGTGNLLARAARIPNRVDDAVALITGDHAYMGLDTMYAAGRHFVLNIGTGISSHSIHDTSPEEKRRFGMLAYIWWVVKHIFGFKSYRFDIDLDGYRRTVDATELLVSNGTLMENLPNVLGPQETFSDGRIDVYVIHGRSVLDYALIILRALIRRPGPDDRFVHFSVTRRMTITAHRRSCIVQGDNEVVASTPIQIDVVPAAVQLITPAHEKSPGVPQDR